jgi:hypothetical protein
LFSVVIPKMLHAFAKRIGGVGGRIRIRIRIRRRRRRRRMRRKTKVIPVELHNVLYPEYF